MFNTTPFQVHSATSKAAAVQAVPTARLERERVYNYIVGQQKAGGGGATDEEIADALGMNPNTARPRRIELVEQQRVQNSGTTRETRSKRPASVWEPVVGTAKPIVKRQKKAPHCSSCTCGHSVSGITVPLKPVQTLLPFEGVLFKP